VSNVNEKKSSLLKYVGKERELFKRYTGAHPHFKRNILLDAFISSALVFVVFGFLNQVADRARAGELLRSGGVEMTSDELVQHVKSEGITAYWLGPVQGYKYTIICKDRKEIIVTYLPQGVGLNHPDRYNLTIETYARTLKSEQAAPPNIMSDNDDFVALNGTNGITYLSDPRMVTFKPLNTDKTVEVQYPSGTPANDILVDAERLKLISEIKA
jgi:hypothetical protein